jgi:hypothetical protein
LFITGLLGVMNDVGEANMDALLVALNQYPN